LETLGKRIVAQLKVYYFPLISVICIIVLAQEDEEAPFEV